MELLKHVAKYHYKYQNDAKDENSKDDEVEKQNPIVKYKEKENVSDFVLDDLEDLVKK